MCTLRQPGCSTIKQDRYAAPCHFTSIKKKKCPLAPSFAVSCCNLVAAPEPDNYTHDHVHTNRAGHIVLVD